jgi:enolase
MKECVLDAQNFGDFRTHGQSHAHGQCCFNWQASILYRQASCWIGKALINCRAREHNSLTAAIVSVHGRQIFDSRGRPTVEVEVQLVDGSTGRAAVPSGASTGRYEAHELRDGDFAAFEGLGVSRAVAHVNGELGRAIIGQDAQDQRQIDDLLRQTDGTADCHRLGANAVLGVSLATCRGAANYRRRPLYAYIAELAGVSAPVLPMPMVNILSGGAHAQNSMDFQDFLVIPAAAPTFGRSLQMIAAVRAAADRLMLRRGLTTLLADEGGLSPGCRSAREALDLLVEAIEQAGFRPGKDVAIAVDVAASELLEAPGRYRFEREDRTRSTGEMIDLMTDLAKFYPIVSIEDPLDQEDWNGWKQLTDGLPGIQIIGDDLFTTDPARIASGVSQGIANAVLVKVNQIGTLTAALEAISIARAAGYRCVISARSGETEDSFIADLAVGTASGQVKIGSFRSSERLSKYNQLIRIEESIGGSFAGREALPLGCSAPSPGAV